jgi:hypothetical protein
MPSSHPCRDVPAAAHGPKTAGDPCDALRLATLQHDQCATGQNRHRTDQSRALHVAALPGAGKPAVVHVPNPIQNRTKEEIEAIADQASGKVMALLVSA